MCKKSSWAERKKKRKRKLVPGHKSERKSKHSLSIQFKLSSRFLKNGVLYDWLIRDWDRKRRKPAMHTMSVNGADVIVVCHFPISPDKSLYVSYLHASVN